MCQMRFPTTTVQSIIQAKLRLRLRLLIRLRLRLLLKLRFLLKLRPTGRQSSHRGNLIPKWSTLKQ